MTGPWQGKTIDTLLDEGSAGLQYWIEFLPLYESAFGGNGGRGNLDRLLAMYDEQRGMRLDKLDEAAAALRTAVDEADRQWDTQQSCLRRLPGLWQGAAADAAFDMLGKQAALAEETRGHARDAAGVLAEMSGSLRSAVAAKAFATRELLEGPVGGGKMVRIDGKSPEDVQVIVDVYHAREWISADQVRELGRMFPALAVPEHGGGRTDLGSGEFGDKVRSLVSEWLNSTFKPDFDRKLSSYVDVCGEVDRFCKSQYRNLIAALAEVSDRAYPCPQSPAEVQGPAEQRQSEQPKDQGMSAHPGSPTESEEPQTPPTVTPGSDDATATIPSSESPGTDSTPATTTAPTSAGPTETASAPVASAPVASAPTASAPTTSAPTTSAPVTSAPTTSAPVTPAPTTPAPATTPVTPTPATTGLDGLAALSQVTQTLSPLASTVTQAVEQGLSALGATIKSGIDDAIESLTKSMTPEIPDSGGGDEKDRHTDPHEQDGSREAGGDPDSTEKKHRDAAPRAEFDIEGKHLEFEMEPDGQLKLVVSDSTGTQREFAVELDEHGMPVISGTGPERADTPSETPVEPAPSGTVDQDQRIDSAPVPDEDPRGSGPIGTPPTTRRAEDGEHRPTPIPDPGAAEQADTPFDSGARLAEAGPL